MTITFEEAYENLVAAFTGEELDRYLCSLPGRCQECGHHIATQNHRPGPQWFTGFEPWVDAEIEEAHGCSQWSPLRLAGIPPGRCPSCGDPWTVVGLTSKCRDFHEICACGNRFDEPKAKHCRRRKHPKDLSGWAFAPATKKGTVQ